MASQIEALPGKAFLAFGDMKELLVEEEPGPPVVVPLVEEVPDDDDDEVQQEAITEGVGKHGIGKNLVTLRILMVDTNHLMLEEVPDTPIPEEA